MKLKGVFVAAMLLTPTAALAAPGVVTASVSMRAGPGPGFPTVDRIPGGARVDIHGCLQGDAWCDVSWSGDRGWVSSRYLKYLYRNRYVYLPDYVDDVPIVPFVLSSYWATYYSGRPWYHRHAYWNRYWHSHARFATHVPPDRFRHVGRHETRPVVTGGLPRHGIAQGAPPPRGFAHVRGPHAVQRSVQGNMPHLSGPGRTFSRVQQPMPMQQPLARGHEARSSAAPIARPAMPAHVAQPGLGRVGGAPMGAQAQMGGMRAAPAMPHMGGGGGAPRVAAPHVGGGGPAGGGGLGRPHR
jgi:uncharacterized protein YraI